MKVELTTEKEKEILNEKTLSQSEVDQRLKCTHQPIVFHGSILKNLDLSNRNLNGVNFAGILIQNVNFKNSDCSQTNFFSTIMENVNFEGSDIRASIFSQTKIKNCNFQSVKAPIYKRIYLWFKNEN